MGLLCKQWIREYQHYSPTVSHQERIQVSQLRYEAFQDWGVTGLLSFLPILLQSSLLLFFAGILDLLWSLHRLVAVLTTIIIGLNVLVLFTTTVLPSCLLVTFSSERMFRDKIILCPYKSPQAWLFHRLVSMLPPSILRNEIISTAYDWASAEYSVLSNHYSRGFGKRTYLVRGIKWIMAKFSSSLEMFGTTFHCLQDLSAEECTFVVSDITTAFTSRDQMYYNLYYWMDQHSDVQQFRAECLLRHMNLHLSHNIAEQPSDFSWDRVETLAAIQTFEPDVRSNLSRQLVGITKRIISNDRLAPEDVPRVLRVCITLCDSPSQEIQAESLTILQAFELWISRLVETPAFADIIVAAIKTLTRLFDTGAGLPGAFVQSKEGIRFLEFLDRILKSRVDADVVSQHDLFISQWIHVLEALKQTEYTSSGVLSNAHDCSA
ncbi:hypothetical protein VKT23_011127 [Stygiomarasmius scandens]|uniref:DUF6535 domain-containing protein n=1 Tax=Marasmiellus scandens TaxID=2682957 RepID=A0ABR1JE21_9AGAR